MGVHRDLRNCKNCVELVEKATPVSTPSSGLWSWSWMLSGSLSYEQFPTLQASEGKFLPQKGRARQIRVRQ